MLLYDPPLTIILFSSQGFSLLKKKKTSAKCFNDIIDRKTITVTLEFEMIWELRDSPKCFPYNYFHKNYSLSLVTNSFFQWFSNPLQLCTAIGWSSRSSQPHVLTGGSSQRFAVLNLLLAGNTCSKQSLIICCSLKAPEIPYPCSQDGLQPLETLLNIAQQASERQRNEIKMSSLFAGAGS